MPAMTSTPHRALYCNDILEEIFLKLQEQDEDGTRSLGSLARAAVVCRAFSSYALDALWADVDSLKPILRFFRCYDLTNPKTTACMERTIDAQSVSRFQEYAWRIRALHVHSEHDQSARSAFLLALFRHERHSAALFPNLRRLRWQALFLPDPGLQLVLTPSVRHVELNWDDRDWNERWDAPVDGSAVISQVLHTMQKELLDLDELHLSGICEALTFPTLNHWTHLRAFGSRDLTVDVPNFDVLSQLVNLQELQFSASDEVAHHTVQSGFLSLRSLIISGSSARIALSLPSFRHSPHLHTLQLHTDWRAPSQVAPHLFQALSDLRHIEHFLLDAESIGIPSLTDNISPTNTPSLTDVPGLWRGLKTCTMSIRWPYGQALSLPLELLLAFARQCPRLEALSLPPLDFRPVLPPNAPPETAVLSRSLRELNVSNMVDGVQWEWEEALPLFVDRAFAALDLRRMARSADRRVEKPSPPFDDKWLRWAAVVEKVKAVRDRRSGGGAYQ
ncbi:uncharacterized protein B0H18DRAFT_954289 [Fomitopsis serialis]|uniref:uncharacterized protein n=1 Tax=Fomitopsis serialis TaxID=139415 RepID=UPI002007F3A4|nr:uncharacterized protein B0H18DRAFT_954289 [Neoantrodia serialis]KAH9927571.1 hypothetical protein B0H18DRAFT_954289 [Neoantrodia serialis]